MSRLRTAASFFLPSLVAAGLLVTALSPAFPQVAIAAPSPLCEPDPPTPPALAYSDTIECRIDPVGDIDDFTFNAAANDRVLVRMANAGGVGAIGPEVRILRGGAPVAGCQAAGANIVEVQCSLPNAGSHTIRVNDQLGDQTGGYFLHLQRLNGPANATGIAFGQTLPGAIGSRAETDAFVFNAAANDRVLVRMANAGGVGAIGPEARIFNSAGTLVAGCSGFAANLLEFQCTLPASGSYALVVQDSLGDQTGGYSLHLGIICTITGTAGNDVLNGGAGRDVICPLGGNDIVNGGGGNDVFVSAATADGSDVFNGGLGNDQVTYGLRSGSVSVDLDNVADDGAAGEGDNVRIDVENIVGGLGNDILIGRAGISLLHGGQGSDTLRGQGGNDILHGQGNNDTILGGGGNDTMNGQTGNDTLRGGSGDDFMDGGVDVDTCDGGGHVVGDTAVNCETVTGVP